MAKGFTLLCFNLLSNTVGAKIPQKQALQILRTANKTKRGAHQHMNSRKSACQFLTIECPSNEWSNHDSDYFSDTLRMLSRLIYCAECVFVSIHLYMVRGGRLRIVTKNSVICEGGFTRRMH